MYNVKALSLLIFGFDSFCLYDTTPKYELSRLALRSNSSFVPRQSRRVRKAITYVVFTSPQFILTVRKVTQGTKRARLTRRAHRHLVRERVRRRHPEAPLVLLQRVGRRQAGLLVLRDRPFLTLRVVPVTVTALRALRSQAQLRLVQQRISPPTGRIRLESCERFP